MSDDLSARLSQPGVPDAFETAVSLYVEACARNDPEVGWRAGIAIGALHEMIGGGDETHDALILKIRDAAAEAVLRGADLPPAA